jgi:DNA repair protein RecO (recombination protein O)
MIEKTKGIVLQYFRYGESSIIAHMYTESHGRQTFIIKGIRSRKSKLKSNLIQPLFILNIEYYHKDSRDIQLIKEISLQKIFSFPYNIIKAAQAMFLAEILSKVLKEESKNEDLFCFISEFIEYFDNCESGSSNFHIYFLLKLMRFLGILPSARESKEFQFFDMMDGDYKIEKPGHPEYLMPEHTRFLQYLLQAGYEDLSRIKMNRLNRQLILDRVLRFYSLHIEGIDKLKGREVLQEVFG